MELFYIPEVLDSEAVLEGEELHHAARVLRKTTGDHIQFTDGRGVLYTGQIEKMSKREARINILNQRVVAQEGYLVTLATALTKNIKRMEWCFEKITELGVHRIQPIICKRSERSTMNLSRMQKILIAAMKQSERCTIPQLDEPMLFEDMLTAKEILGAAYIAHRGPESVMLRTHYAKGQSVLVLVGPEGDFTDGEIAAAETAQFQPVSLGNARLRTETAGLFAVASVHALNMM